MLAVLLACVHLFRTTAFFIVIPLEHYQPQGRAGGACTSALLKVLYNHGHVAAPMSWVELLRRLRSTLNQMGYDQVPQLTSSRLIDVNKTMYIVPPGSTGRRRAILSECIHFLFFPLVVLGVR
jgi:hypothetical protein